MDLSLYKHITSDSRKVINGGVFVSFNNDINHIKESIKNGAKLIVTTKEIDINFNNLIVKNIKYFFSYWYKRLNKIDIDLFTIIAVTGTDGKTTITKMIYDVIGERYKALLIGTNGITVDNKTYETVNTTPDIEIILECLLYAKNNNIKYIILEASSEGLLSERLTGIKVDLIIFTNLSHEHLNTHNTLQNYFNAKRKLLKLLKKDGIVISNKEDFYGRKYHYGKTYFYGLHKGKIRTLSFELKNDCTKIFLINNKRTYYYKIPFVGVYNVYNFLATHLAISLLFNINLFNFNNLTPPKGRFINLSNKIIIDFAHTPNALESLLLTVKEIYKDKKIALVLGAQGGKDKSKRILLGNIADKYCDCIFLTSEDPKNEEILDIILDINLGIKHNIYYVELNRKNAIIKACDLIKNNYIIIIVGKGMENSINIKNTNINHSDYEIALTII